MSKINIKTSIKQNDKIQEEIETKGILQDNKIKYVNDKKVTGALTAIKADAFSEDIIIKKGKKMFRKFTK